MTKLPWTGSWEESLWLVAKDKDRAVFYVPLKLFYRLDAELGNRSVGTYGVIVNRNTGQVFCLAGDTKAPVVTVVTETGSQQYDISDWL